MYLNKTRQWGTSKTTPGSAPCSVGMGRLTLWAANFMLNNTEECPSSRMQVHQEGLAGRISGNPMPCPDAVGGSVASQGVVPLWATWQLLPGKPDSLPGSVLLAGLLPAAGWLCSRDSNGSSGGGGRGGKSVCLCGRKGRIARTVSGKPLGVRYPGVCAARLRGSRGGGGEWPEGAVQSWDGRARGCARGGRAAARWAVGDPIVGRRLSRVNAPLWAGASRGAGQQMPP